MSYQSLIITKQSDKDLSKLQKQFNTNVDKIKELKQRLTMDKSLYSQIMTRIQSDIIPLEKKHNEKLVQLIYVFDRHYDDKFFKRKEKEKIADIILDRIVDLIQGLGKEELKPIYEKYAKQSYENANEQAENITIHLLKDMIESKYGIKIDDNADLSSSEKIQEYINKKISENRATKTEKTKTAKQLAKEEKLKQEAQNISKAARSIYTDLVKAFHPDREQDESKKERKTEIMKLVTLAYEKDDLFELLRLKMSLQDAGTSLTMADEQLKNYNKILQEQINDLQRELNDLRRKANGGTNSYDLFKKYGGDEIMMKMKFSFEISRLKKGVQALERNILTLKNKDFMRDFLRDYDAF